MNPESKFCPESISSIDKVVARTSEEKKEVDGYFAEKFLEQKSEKVAEITKSEEQIKLINFINDETNNLLEKYGLEKFDVSPDYIHILSKEDFRDLFGKSDKEKTAYGNYHPLGQAIAIDQSKVYPKTAFTHILFHELLHFKSHQIAHKIEDNKYDLQQRGTAIFLKGEKSYFANLDEFIIEELTIRNQKKIIGNEPDFKKEKDAIQEYVEQKKKEGKQVDEDELMSVRKVIAYSPDNKKQFIKFKKRNAAYRNARGVYNNLIDKIYARNMESFTDREEIFDLFAKSVFTGNIVGEKSWGRLVDKTFGSGTLKQLAEKDSDLKDLKKIVDKL